MPCHNAGGDEPGEPLRGSQCRCARNLTDDRNGQIKPFLHNLIPLSNPVPMSDPAVHHGEIDLRGADVFGCYLVQILFNDDDVRQFADLQCEVVAIFETCV